MPAVVGSPVLAWELVPTAVGELLIAALRSDARARPRLARVELGQRDGLAGLEQLARERFEAAALVRDASFLAPVARQLVEYGRGERRSFELELDPGGSEFQRAVWAGLRAIPFGATCTYAQLARRIGRPRALRAVGQANGANPLPLVVPCHRVLASSGLGGFSGAPEFKLRLLAHEGSLLPGLADLEPAQDD